jgi:predicted O-linked N-acetylglucosamine transferase (SPINDLY family)
MGVSETIAARLEDYAPLALALGRDPERRAAIRAASKAASARLFADIGAVRELESFLIAASKAADAGERLPSGWQPPRA